MPRFAIGEGHAVYEGPVTDSAFHRHAAFQIAIALQGEITMLDGPAARHRSVALVVPPMVRHRMLGTAGLRTFFVEPHCAFADRHARAPRPRRQCDLRDLAPEDIGASGERACWRRSAS